MTSSRSRLTLLPLLGPETRPTRPPPTPPVRSRLFGNIPSPEQLITLPKVLIYKILSELSPYDLANICKANSQLAGICKERQFWKFKHNISFGSLPQKPDQRIIFYEKEMEKLNRTSINLQDQARETAVNLIMSTLKKQPPKQSIGQIESEDEYKVDPNTNQLGKDIYQFARLSFRLNETYEKLVNRILKSIRPPLPPRTFPGGQRMPAARRLISQDLENQIDPNAKLFEEYPLSEFNNDPIVALVTAIFDNISPYKVRILKLYDEMEEIGRVLNILRDAAYVQDID